LGGEIEAGWYLEATVAKEGAHELVRKNFGAKGPQCDRGLLLGRDKPRIQLRGRGGEVVVERR
jgi:hypothetical protein